MFQFFSFNLDGLNKKENAGRFISLGLVLIILGTLSLIYKGLGIKLVSWLLGLSLLFIAYLNLKNINELARYTPKEELKPYKRNQAVLLVVIVLLFLFPTKIQSMISLVLGVYLVVSQLLKITASKNDPYFRFGLLNILIFLFGLTLIISPLFLSRFISSIMSLIVIVIGLNLFATGNRLR
ncbi:hypothetical protein HF520_08085 [Romboutsia sp. CE17]|uniref:DUF308 domain-containing protein n=1 Tax=Romboutsia sp. CE17 TaxID=2724150 RepID=UPI001442B546|nr:DUF308 domain-containing protein [Romboutsia sp. CE17]QJA08910.1 hypothetical protein HF520_08085 [Romboutsia sp. CE17]